MMLGCTVVHNVGEVLQIQTASGDTYVREQERGHTPAHSVERASRSPATSSVTSARSTRKRSHTAAHTVASVLANQPASRDTSRFMKGGDWYRRARGLPHRFSPACGAHSASLRSRSFTNMSGGITLRIMSTCPCLDRPAPMALRPICIMAQACRPPSLVGLGGGKVSSG